MTLRAPRPNEVAEVARRWAEVDERSEYVSDADRSGRFDRALAALVTDRGLGRVAASEALLERWRDSDHVVVWVIEVDAKLAGMTNLRDIDRDEQQATSGIHVYPEFRSRGIASEAVALRTAYAFGELDLHKVKSDTWVENAAMLHILRKQGYREVGVFRAETRRNGQWHDVWQGELVREDWERPRGFGEPAASTPRSG